ncbi:YciI family protein [Sphingopyxis sp. PET50]|uniref:YciI family protein n=1 Tax=Sphingopyxis sp. PET50 TaxID=2976533 RepID=UPI0021AF4EF1|nr:YciI family protein [Sphingopyxis sp. PET50]
MRILCLCHDAAGASKRSELFEAHTIHNIGHLPAFFLTGPIASADGSSGVGDDPRLCGSVYCLDVAGLDEVRTIMEADPFMQGAWNRIDYYDWGTATGAWDDPAARPFGLGADYRCYIAFSADPAGEALMAGPVALLGSTGHADTPLRSVAVLKANDMAAATAQAPGADRVVAMPIAIGRWVGISSAMELADYRSRIMS